MRILHVQNGGVLERLGVSDCYFKYFDFGSIRDTYTDKTHFHSGFELHFVLEGRQTYESVGHVTELESGDCIVIPPQISHRVLSCDKNTIKTAITFDYDFRTDRLRLPRLVSCSAMKLDDDVRTALAYIIAESEHPRGLSAMLVENRILELLVSVFRGLGMDEALPIRDPSPSPTILMLAKQYIADNIERAPSVSDVALYCNLSTKQLTRIFVHHEGESVFDYIRARRVERIKRLLEEKTLSLREISERMSFTSEYYFSNFFKNSCGLPPGAYRAMF